MSKTTRDAGRGLAAGARRELAAAERLEVAERGGKVYGGPQYTVTAADVGAQLERAQADPSRIMDRITPTWARGEQLDDNDGARNFDGAGEQPILGRRFWPTTRF